MTEEIPVVGLREPCPCGSGKRYKACHGKARSRESVAHVTRPFEGLPNECDWVAFREIVPAATAPLTLKDATDRQVILTTVLPLAWPALVRDNGDIYLALQVTTGSDDPSRDAADALLRALPSSFDKLSSCITKDLSEFPCAATKIFFPSMSFGKIEELK